MPLDAFLSDAAITKPEDDRLDRAAFAKRLASALLSWKQEDSIVIGLFGPWGSGKTSVVNMTLSYLNSATNDSAKEDAPIVVKFNPWHFSDQGHLLGLFFGELLQGIRQGAPQKFEWLKTKLGDLGEMLSPIGDAPVVGDYVKPIAGVAKALGQKASLVELRKEADKAFRDLGRRVIIVMDDIDRLTQLEIRQLFQTIKLNADFPNTIYLIVADRVVIERSLTTEQGVSGRAYLEKIVQVGFDIPPPDPSHITEFLEEQIQLIVSSVMGGALDPKPWNALYDSGFRNLFDTMRDAKRFANAISFTSGMVRDEVNSVDFIGLEALRVFTPEIYVEIANRKHLFLYASRSVLPERVDYESLQKELNDITKLAGTHQEDALGICRQLFPQVDGIFQRVSYSSGGWQRSWRADRRICSQDMFDTYFLLRPRSGEITRKELDHLAKLASNPEALTEAMNEYGYSGRFVRLTDWLPDLIGKQSKPGILGFCEALLTIAEERTDERRSLSGWGTTSRLVYIAGEALRELDEQERCDWLLHQIESGRNLYAVVNQVAGEEISQGRRPINPLWSDEWQKELQKSCIVQLRNKAKTAELRKIKNILGILLTWKKWTDTPSEVDDYLGEILIGPEAILDFIADCLYEMRVYAGSGETPAVYQSLNLDNLGELTNLDGLKDSIASVRDRLEKLTSRQQMALEVFERELLEQAKRPGPPSSDSARR